MFFLTAFLIGFLGSFHCVGMCGPIAMALPYGGTTRNGFLFGRLLYNAGRITTYSILGLITGFAGHYIAIAGFQKSVSILSGVLILLMIVVPYLTGRLKYDTSFIYRWTNQIKIWFKKLFKIRSQFTLYWIGGVNGLLPCGFVYLALISSLSVGSPLSGMTYMMAFGLGTLPLMFGLSLTGKIVGKKYQSLISKATPVIAFCMAVFLIGRGILIENHSCCHH